MRWSHEACVECLFDGACVACVLSAWWLADLRGVRGGWWTCVVCVRVT